MNLDNLVYDIIEQWKFYNDYDKTLDISGLELTSLPKLPHNVRRLCCENNNIEEIETKELPKNLEVLNCARNKLKYLPELPEMLSILICSHNQINGLPDIPKYLTNLVCSFNDLSDILGPGKDKLSESLVYLDCSNNINLKIDSYVLPENLKFYIHENYNYKNSKYSYIINMLNEDSDTIILDINSELVYTSRTYILENGEYHGMKNIYYIPNLDIEISSNIYDMIILYKFSYYKI